MEMNTNNHYLDAFRQEKEYMRNFGFDPYSKRVNLAIPNAREWLMAGLQSYLGDDAKWLPAYEEIAEWLTDNHGKGLLLIGTCGLGKTLICQNILPMIIRRFTSLIAKAYTANAMNKNIDKMIGHRVVVVDDLGTEQPETLTYGERRYPFNELVDSAERNGSLLIITTNLGTYHAVNKKTGNPIPSIEDRYGIRTLDRLRATTSVVLLSGESMRH